MAKKIISELRKPFFVYDVNNEYGTGKTLPTISEFLSLVCDETKVKNSVILFEEATIFFNHSKSEKVTNLLVRKRHTRNCIIFLFHSLADVPPYILRLIDFIILFATNDNPGVIERKFKDFPEILTLYHDVLKGKQTNFHFCKVKALF